MTQRTLFITGGAGYVGAMLADQFHDRPEIKEIICLDKNEMPDLLKGKSKIFWITANTSDDTWQEVVRAKQPDTVINTAWQIREMYGKKELQWKWNVIGSRKVFDFAFSTPSVKKLIHFSTASGYGAEPTNTLEHLFKEEETLRENIYLYGIEKIAAEKELEVAYAKAKSSGNVPQVFVVRPAALTGPRGRYMFRRFGLQSVLRKGLPIIPIANDIWCRQFIHEDDVCDIVDLLTFKDLKGQYEVFNITPNSIVLAHDMAEVMKKKTFRITPFIVRCAFFILWHLSRGKIPTSKGGWRFYSYPIVMDGRKLTNMYGYKYQYESRPALENKTGRYAKYIPESEK
ncbi:MAG: NAD-dependent epimerase/dehydratase family protein [Candidatus Taylorbacteria bacterium]|nr:NAD-dependent epimerase/dehydratase family protein [Candidatus Taylorbacteria bacterium]